ncbi:MAG: HAD family hydrolase [Anaerococcus sp.]|nr:HAD family hydrolase [Anaerococcus sp.]
MYIFDIDGTLLYTIDAISFHINKTLKAYGLGEVEKDKVRDFVGNGPRVLMNKSLDRVRASKDDNLREEILNAYNLSYDNNPSYLTRPYEGIRESLDELKSRGEKLVCFSNKPHSTAVKVIEDVFGKGYFDFILGYDKSYKRKPSAEGIYIIQEKFAEDFSRILYFGDSEVDIRCGKNASVFTIACSWGFRDRDILEKEKPDLIIDRVDQINSIRRI